MQQVTLLRYLCRDIVLSVPMFQRANIAFVDEIVHRLKTVFVCTGDTICYQGEIAKVNNKS